MVGMECLDDQVRRNKNACSSPAPAPPPPHPAPSLSQASYYSSNQSTFYQTKIGTQGMTGKQGQKGQQGPSGPGGVVYIRWGRTTCPSDNSVVYQGRRLLTKRFAYSIIYSLSHSLIRSSIPPGA